MTAPSASWEDLFARPLLFVSGKGGTGKSTVAAALAGAATSTGRRVLLAEVEGRGEIPRVLPVADPGFTEVTAPGGFSVLSITPGEAVAEYAGLFLGLDRTARRILRTALARQAMSTIPGFHDLLACGKLFEITHVRRENPRDSGRPLYDLVVVDAPPTGQVAAFLSAPTTFAGLLRVGRLKRQATQIARMLRREAHVVLVSTLEEMAVAETEEAVPAIAAGGVPVAAVVANRVASPVGPPGTRRAFAALTPGRVAEVARAGGARVDEDGAAELLEEARSDDALVGTQVRLARDLERAASVLALPELPGLDQFGLVRTLERIMAGRPDSEAVRSTAAVRADRPPGAVEVTGDASLTPHLRDARLIIACGSGGVGKTTVSAAIAVHLARRGRRTVLLTVDPARRLATALRLPLVPGERTTVPVGGGRMLLAEQLDTQRTFDELIERHAGTPERRDRILSNPYYRRIADTLSGTHEYMAMEKLYQLATEEDHDAIVIDTPPTRSALSFLDAPRRLTDFLGGAFLRMLLRPSAAAGRLGLGVARFGAAAFTRTLGRLVGGEVLSDVIEFLVAFEGMYAGFKDRASKVLELLSSEGCAFVVVTAPTPASLGEAAYFIERLDEGRMRAAAVVANRWHPERRPVPPGAAEAVERLGEGGPEDRAVGAVLANRLQREPRHVAEGSAMQAFAQSHPAVPVIGIPALGGDVHDVTGLRRIGAHLFDARPEDDPDGT